MVFAQIKTEENKEKKDERTENTLRQDDNQASSKWKKKIIEIFWKFYNVIKLCGEKRAGRVKEAK